MIYMYLRYLPPRSKLLLLRASAAHAGHEVFLCFGVLTAYFALGGIWNGVPMGILATCVAFAMFQMSQFEGLRPSGQEIGRVGSRGFRQNSCR